MKKTLPFLIIFVLFFLATFSADALTPTPTPTVDAPTPSPSPSQAQKQSLVDQEINDLKTKIASKVAELRLVEHRGILGRATDITNSQLTVTDTNGNTRYIDVDELTKFASPSAKEFGISDITKGTEIGVFGLYNKQSERILARFVNVVDMPVMIHGIVTTIDLKNYNFSYVSSDNKTYTIEVESTTKTYSFNKDTGLTKSGFSKLESNEHTIVIGYPNIQNPSDISATRILIFPTIPKDPNITADTILPTNTVAPQITTTPATTSGKQLK